MNRVGIIGVGQLPFRSRRPETHYAFGLEAVSKALNDAHITRNEVDAIVYGIYSEPALRQGIPDIFIQDYLGMQGKTGLKVAAGEATGGHAIYAAVSQILAGTSEVVVLLAVQKMSDLYDFDTASHGDGYVSGGSLFPNVVWERPVIPTNIAYLTAACLIPHMNKWGGPTEEQVAKVSVKNHQNALANPLAQLKLNLTAKDVLNSRLIAHPTTLFECCLYGDGAAVLILASEEKAKALCDKPVWIAATAMADYSHRLEAATLGRLPGVADAARKAYNQARITDPLNQLDVIELQDLISGIEPIAYEELGLCAPGRGGDLIDEGVVMRNGKLPVNPHGGCVACGHVGGVCDISTICDVVKQLQERAGDIQVPIHHGRGLVEAVCSAASFSTVTILERER